MHRWPQRRRVEGSRARAEAQDQQRAHDKSFLSSTRSDAISPFWTVFFFCWLVSLRSPALPCVNLRVGDLSEVPPRHPPTHREAPTHTMHALTLIVAAALQPPPPSALTRRAALVAAASFSATPALADETAPRVLTDEEMEARVARKMELLRAASKGGSAPRASSAANSGLAGSLESNMRNDFNPDAAVQLRSRSMVDNAKVAMAKQDELKKRDKKQKRDDLCEMLGRGC